MPNQLFPFPIDYDALRIAVIREVQKVTGLVCIVNEPETTNAPRPPIPYLAMKIITPGTRYGDDSMFYKSGTNFGRSGPRRMTISFNSYAKSHEQAYNYMALWQGSLDLKTIQSDLKKAGIAVWVIGNVADLSLLLNTGFEGRAQMDVQFGITSNLTEDLSNIQEANISGVVDVPPTQNVDIDVVGP